MTSRKKASSHLLLQQTPLSNQPLQRAMLCPKPPRSNQQRSQKPQALLAAAAPLRQTQWQAAALPAWVECRSPLVQVLQQLVEVLVEQAAAPQRCVATLFVKPNQA